MIRMVDIFVENFLNTNKKCQLSYRYRLNYIQFDTVNFDLFMVLAFNIQDMTQSKIILTTPKEHFCLLYKVTKLKNFRF